MRKDFKTLLQKLPKWERKKNNNNNNTSSNTSTETTKTYTEGKQFPNTKVHSYYLF